MVKNTNISFQITKEELEKVQEALSMLDSVLTPKLQAVNPAQKYESLKLGEKNLPFVTKAYEYASQNPDLLPPYLDVNKMKVNLEAVETLRNIHHSLNKISSLVQDSMFLSGSELFADSLTFYELLKTAAKNNFSSAQVVYDDLSKRFQGKRKKRKLPDVSTRNN